MASYAAQAEVRRSCAWQLAVEEQGASRLAQKCTTRFCAPSAVSGAPSNRQAGGKLRRWHMCSGAAYLNQEKRSRRGGAT